MVRWIDAINYLLWLPGYLELVGHHVVRLSIDILLGA